MSFLRGRVSHRGHRVPGVKPYRDDLRAWHSAIRLLYKKSDILLLGDGELEPGPGIKVLQALWDDLEDYLHRHPLFGMSLEPIRPLPGAPRIAMIMARAGARAGVGPMASVAGAFAEEVARAYPADLAVENGGDVFVRSQRPLRVEVFAGKPGAGRVFVEVIPGSWGIASSSGRMGPSLSLGRAWAATVVAESGALADAWATRLANAVQPDQSLEGALDLIRGAPGVLGAVLVAEGQMALWGLTLLGV